MMPYNFSKTKQAQFGDQMAPGGYPPVPPADPTDMNPDLAEMGAEDDLEIQQAGISFGSFDEYKQWLEEQNTPDESGHPNGFNNALSQIRIDPLIEKTDSQTGQQVNLFEEAKTGLEEFYSAEDETTREEAALRVWKALPEAMKPSEEGIEAEYKENVSGENPNNMANEKYKKFIESSADQIQKLAKDSVKKTSSFNFNKSNKVIKSAQHKLFDQVRMWGPDEKRYDPFFRQPVSDWHIVERNKGFGLTLDDYWNIDWEAIWRGSIMDKYSRPYRNKDGEWVGGYIQKRFEVDKWIPEPNNMQLKPGQKRKPIIPAYGNTEMRLQEMRSNNDRGYGPESDTSKPFNWNEASSKRTVKIARHDAIDLTISELPPDIKQEIKDDLDIMGKRRPDLDNMSPKEFGRALYQRNKDNPGSVDISQYMDQRIRDAYHAVELADQMFADSKSGVKVAKKKAS